MGGIFALSNTSSGGLAAHIKLQRSEQYGRIEPAPKGRSAHVAAEEEI